MIRYTGFESLEITLIDLEIHWQKAIIEHQVTQFLITPALFNALVDTNIESLVNVKKTHFGGESASLTHVLKKLLNIVVKRKM